jgi:divalent metal cation (Fe/Co/Zn/Cd) transporter
LIDERSAPAERKIRSMTQPEPTRASLVQRGRFLSRATFAYNAVEGIVAILAGSAAGSVALIGFGVDSGIELTASVAALWRLEKDADAAKREHAEKLTHRIIGVLFLTLALYVTVDAGIALWNGDTPEESTVGIVLAALSLLVMPLLARAKRNVAIELGSRALRAESMQTNLCTILSAILLAGLGLNALLGWWWADPIAALAMVPIIAREGLEGMRGEAPCSDDCQTNFR